MEFSTIRSIDLERPETWEDKAFLTIDIDWASDDVLAHTMDILERRGVAATWFVTHDTPLLERLRHNPRFELGLHPNFNPLLLAKEPHKDARAVVRALQELVPEATSIRSHSMCQSSRLIQLFAQMGLKADCNHFIPKHSGVILKPWHHWEGMLKVPYFWEDDIHAIEGGWESPESFLAWPGLKVFDFHPIHVALNTNDLAVYEGSRAFHRDFEALRAHHRCSGYGVESFLEELLDHGEGPGVGLP